MAAVVAATAVMVCAVVVESGVDEFVTDVETVEAGVATGVDAVVAWATGAFAVVVGATDEFAVVVTVGAGLLAGTGVGAGAVGAVAWAVVTAGVSVLKADASVVVTGETVVAAVVVAEVVGIWLFVNGVAPHVVVRVVIASTDGMFCVLWSCEAWSMAWIIIVAMSEPVVTVEESLVLEVEVAGVVAVAVVTVVLFALESRVICAGVFPAGRVCAVAIAEAIVLAVVKLVTVTGVVLVVVVLLGELFCPLEFFPRGVKASEFCGVVGVVVAVVVAPVLAVLAVAASSTLTVRETVSRSGERPSRMVAGATMVIERVAGACGAGVPAAAVVVVAGVAEPTVAALLLGVVTSALCWSMTLEKLCD